MSLSARVYKRTQKEYELTQKVHKSVWVFGHAKLLEDATSKIPSCLPGKQLPSDECVRLAAILELLR